MTQSNWTQLDQLLKVIQAHHYEVGGALGAASLTPSDEGTAVNLA